MVTNLFKIPDLGFDERQDLPTEELIEKCTFSDAFMEKCIFCTLVFFAIDGLATTAVQPCLYHEASLVNLKGLCCCSIKVCIISFWESVLTVFLERSHGCPDYDTEVSFFCHFESFPSVNTP